MDGLEILPLKDTKVLSSFSCGKDEMDDYIRNGLQQSIDAHFCKAFAVKRGKEIVAFFALNFDSLEMDYQEAYDLLHRDKSPIDIRLDYEETFMSKHSYPAIEISYLAVREDLQKKKIGTIIIDKIIEICKAQPIAGCQFITVMAYQQRGGYSAEGFYKKKNFTKIKGGGRNTVRMFRPVYIWEEDFF